jgi:hypothetical protein
MKAISYWANRHKPTARLLIVFLYVLLNYIGWQTGLLLQERQIIVTETVHFATIVFYLAGVVLYPAKSLKKKWGATNYYLRQKSCDFVLISATFLLIVYTGNHAGKFRLSNSASAAAIGFAYPPHDSVKKYKTVTAFAASMKDENGKLLPWKERKQILKQQLREIKKAPELSKTEQSLLIFLFVLLALGLEMGILALSCSLSCSGSEGAALLVGLGATTLVIFLLVLSIRAVKKKKRQMSPPMPTDNTFYLTPSTNLKIPVFPAG